MSALARGVRQHAPDLLVDHGRLAKLLALGETAAVPRPECCSTGRTTASRPARDRRAIRRAGRVPAGSRSMRNRKSGEISSRSSAAWMPGIKTALAAPGLVELDQRVDIGSVGRTTVRTAGEAAEDAACARCLLRWARRLADENAPPARRVARPRAGVRTADDHLFDRGVAVPHVVDRDREHGLPGCSTPSDAVRLRTNETPRTRGPAFAGNRSFRPESA